MKSFHRRTSRPSPKPAPSVPVAAAHPGFLRADQLLVELGLAPSRTTAQRLIEGGRVIGADGPVSKVSMLLPASAELVVRADNDDCYVGRGGIKLASALAHSGIDVAGKTCLDVGQSTGGFSDCLLQNGAARVVGVDVGHGQLHPKLAADPRIESLEGINARDLKKSALAERQGQRLFDLVVADISFISLTLVLPQLPSFLAPDGNLLLLVKPQFEVGPGGIAKGGIVRDTALYADVEAKLRTCCAANHLAVLDWFDSPITGAGVGNRGSNRDNNGGGNHEFFLHAKHEN